MTKNPGSQEVSEKLRQDLMSDKADGKVGGKDITAVSRSTPERSQRPAHVKSREF